MDYLTLTAQHKAEMMQQRLHTLERQVFGLDMEIAEIQQLIPTLDDELRNKAHQDLAMLYAQRDQFIVRMEPLLIGMGLKEEPKPDAIEESEPLAVSAEEAKKEELPEAL